MDFKELSLTRESCRSFQNKDVDKDLIAQVVLEATNAPSACNSQPWKFVACTGETAKLIPEIIITPELKINLWTVDVPVFIIACETKARLMSSLKCDSQRYAAFDLGSATSSICYSAADKGLSTCIIGVFDNAKLKKTLNIPEDVVIRAIVAVGYGTSDSPRSKIRKDISEILSFNQW